MIAMMSFLTMINYNMLFLIVMNINDINVSIFRYKEN